MRTLVLSLSLLIAVLACSAWSYDMTTYSGNDAFPASFTLPDDASPPTAAQVNPALEALGDRTKYLFNRVGVMSHVIFLFRQSTDTAQSANFATSYAPVSMAGIQTGGGILFDCPGLLVGDIVETDFEGTVAIQGAPSGQNSVLMKLQDSQNGGGAADVPGSDCTAGQSPAPTSGQDSPVRCRGLRTITVAGDYQVQLVAQAQAASGPASALLAAGSASATVRVYRPAPGL